MNIQSYVNLNEEISTYSSSITCSHAHELYLYLGDTNGQLICVSPEQSYKVTISSAFPITSITVAHNLLCVGLSDGHILLLDSTTLNSIGQLEGGHESSVHIIASEPDGHSPYIWSCDTQGSICLWDLVSKSLVSQFSSDGKTLIVSGECCEGLFYALCDDGCIRMWLTKSGECVNEIQPSEGDILAFTVIQNQLFSYLSNGTIQLWDFREDCCKVVYECPLEIKQMIWMNHVLILLTSTKLILLDTKKWEFIDEQRMDNVLCMKRNQESVFIVFEDGQVQTLELSTSSKRNSIAHNLAKQEDKRSLRNKDSQLDMHTTADAKSTTSNPFIDDDTLSLDAAIDQMNESSLRQHLKQAHQLLAKASKSKQKLKTELKALREERSEKPSGSEWSFQNLKQTNSLFTSLNMPKFSKKETNDFLWNSHSLLLDQTLKSIAFEISSLQRDLNAFHSFMNQPQNESLEEYFASIKDHLSEPRRTWEVDEDWDSDCEEDKSLAWWRKTGAHRHVFEKLKSPMSNNKRVQYSRQLSPTTDHPLAAAPAAELAHEDVLFAKLSNSTDNLLANNGQKAQVSSNVDLHSSSTDYRAPSTVSERKPSWIKSLVTQIGFGGTSLDSNAAVSPVSPTDRHAPVSRKSSANSSHIPLIPENEISLSQEEVNSQRTVRKKQSFIQKTISQTTSMSSQISKRTSLASMPKLFASFVGSTPDPNSFSISSGSNEPKRSTYPSSVPNRDFDSAKKVTDIDSQRNSMSRSRPSSQDSSSSQSSIPTTLETWGFVPSWLRKSAPPPHRS